MFYKKQNFKLGTITYHAPIKTAITDRNFYEFINQCLDKHDNKPIDIVVKSTFRLPAKFLPLVNFQKTLIISTDIKNGKTLISCAAASVQYLESAQLMLK